jgi:hypothetical protein
VTAVTRANARLANLGPRPPWWRPFARKRWGERVRAIVNAFAEEIAAEAATGMLAALRAAIDRAEGVVN